MENKKHSGLPGWTFIRINYIVTCKQGPVGNAPRLYDSTTLPLNMTCQGPSMSIICFFSHSWPNPVGPPVYLKPRFQHFICNLIDKALESWLNTTHHPLPRELPYPTWPWDKENHLQSYLGWGYVSSLQATINRFWSSFKVVESAILRAKNALTSGNQTKKRHVFKWKIGTRKSHLLESRISANDLYLSSHQIFTKTWL